MSSATLSAEKNQTRSHPPRVLVVDDEQSMRSLFRDVVAAQVDCTMTCVGSVAEAKHLINRDGIELLITDLALPDGDGMSLVDTLRHQQPSAAAMVITGNRADLNGAIGAIRAGAVDFVPKPFNSDQIVERVKRAIVRQNAIARGERRILRLKDAVRRLNQSRKIVTKKVDLLCNDLISAYGDVAKQVEDIRNQESFRKLINSARDLEQMLCHAMDWILRAAGYCNLAVYLAADDAEFQLGAYMKYTIPGEVKFTEAMKQNIVPMASKEGLVHLEGYDVKKYLSAAEHKTLAGNTVLATQCTYLGETLAVLVLFRDEKCPFTADDVAMLKAISPIFAVALAGMVRGRDGDGGDADEGPSNANDDTNDRGIFDEEENEKKRRARKKKEQHDSDWWKRGDPPPF
jgi:FixJ family two-component response regulator